MVDDIVKDVSKIVKNVGDIENQITIREGDIKTNMGHIQDLHNALGIQDTKVQEEIGKVNVLKEEIDTKIEEKVKELIQITKKTAEEKKAETRQRKK